MKSNNIYAAIFISSDEVFLKIADLRRQKSLETVRADIAIGTDIFKHKKISAATVTALVQALKGFKLLLNDYGITENYQALLSYGIKEARNGAFVKSQLEMRTELRIDWLSKSEEHFYYEQIIKAQNEPFNETKASGNLHVVIEPGEVFLSFSKRGAFVFSTEIQLGPLRSSEQFADFRNKLGNFEKLLSDLIFSKLQNLEQILSEAYTYENIVVTDTTALILKKLLAQYDADQTIQDTQFQQFCEEFITTPETQLMESYQLDAKTVQDLLFTVLFLKELMRITSQKRLFLLDITVADAMILKERESKSPESSGFTQDLILLANNLAARYHSNLAHTTHITGFALQLFDRTQRIHHLDKKDRIYLQLASILQDIGGYISPQKHYVHSEQLILASGLLGLSERELQLVAKIARYHSTEAPTIQELLKTLPSEADALLAAKLIALLRIASSLDASHQQHIKKIALRFKKSDLIIEATAENQLHLEHWSFQQKASFFEEVFGMNLQLKVKVRS